MMILKIPVFFAIVMMSNSVLSNSFFSKIQKNESSHLEQDEAFQFSYQNIGENIIAQWIIAEGYYMYRDRINIRNSVGDKITSYKTSDNHKNVYDYSFEQEMDVYYNSMEVTMPKMDSEIFIETQGCSEKGLCYTPAMKIINKDQ